MTIKHTQSILSRLGGDTSGHLPREIQIHVSAVRQILAVFLLKLSVRAQQGLSWTCHGHVSSAAPPWWK